MAVSDQYCSLAIPSVCIGFDSSVQVWQVLIEAIIAAATIVASVVIARAVAQAEVKRAEHDALVARRVRIVNAFALHGEALVRAAHVGEFERMRLPVALGLWSISAEAQTDDEREAAAWMYRQGRQLIDRFDAKVHPPDTDLAVDRLADILLALRRWPTSDHSWSEFQATAEAILKEGPASTSVS